MQFGSIIDYTQGAVDATTSQPPASTTPQPSAPPPSTETSFGWFTIGALAVVGYWLLGGKTKKKPTRRKPSRRSRRRY